MVTIQLPESIAAALAAQARAAGLSLEGYLERLSHQVKSDALPRISAAELDKLIDEEATSGPPYQGTYSRAEIYMDHD